MGVPRTIGVCEVMFTGQHLRAACPYFYVYFDGTMSGHIRLGTFETSPSKAESVKGRTNIVSAGTTSQDSEKIGSYHQVEVARSSLVRRDVKTRELAIVLSWLHTKTLHCSGLVADVEPTKPAMN